MALDSIPFYGAYVARKQQNEAEPTRQLGQLAQFATLQQHFARLEQAKAEQERIAAFKTEMFAAKTPEEQRAVAVRYATPDEVLRMPQPSVPAQVAPALTTVADPARPGKILRVDARTYKGGSLGSAGVLGEVIPDEKQDRSPFYTFLPTETGYVAGNARTGSAHNVTIDGRPVIRSQDSPQLQGRLAGARVTGEAQAKRRFNMTGIGAVIKQADDLLSGINPKTGQPANKPTGSGVGSLVDTAAGFVGATPKGAEEAQALKAVAGALTSKMPRMEGPQSDRDTALYREMAAEVGNEKIPIPSRKRALEVVKMLWEKYESLNPDQFEQPAGLPSIDAIEAELRRRRGK